MTVGEGRVWKFGDNITTDHIISGRFMHLRSNIPELSRHTFEDLRPGFSESVKRGDFVVAGRNFGLGSSREHAPIVIKYLGVQAILAKSFARIFYRNAINIGLPAIICDTDSIDDGDILRVDLSVGRAEDITKKAEIRFSPFPKVMM
ncbi:MAG: 3-isopropylmalate dehydratase, partial [Nitrososphaerota archaeon]